MKTIDFFETLAKSIHCEELAKKLINQLPFEVRNAILTNDQRKIALLQAPTCILANEVEVVSI